MGRIRVLSDVVANKIAAGEVVERPASVVKELLENSLDAGASNLVIGTESGGRRLIRVADDGCGMLRDDALLAFERHATSKLADVKDLLSIATLGFRGEALPSIASVSRLVLETRSAEEITGMRVEINGGRIQRCDETALAPGTTVTVRDVFYNVPARRKFLRSEQTELSHIAQLVTQYSLAHTGRSFRLTHDGRELLNVTPVAGRRERVFQVFGSQALDELIDLGEKERLAPADPDDNRGGRFVLRGFVSNPQVQKLNRNSIFLFVNGRLIRDRLLLHALSSAYQNMMPPACYPFALLFLECDPAEVDVNVHPSKTEVRFRRSNLVHDFVRDAIRDVLGESRPVSSVPVGAIAQPAAALPFSEFTQHLENQRFEAPAASAAVAEVPAWTLRPPPPMTPRFDFDGAPAQFGPPPSFAEAPARLRTVPDTHAGFPAEALSDANASLDALRDLRPLGQLHDSFIVAAGRDGLWIIDQHVAHERVLFERVLSQMAEGRIERQSLLLPVVLDLTPAQQADYERIARELEAAGFDLEPFGARALAVKAAPAALGAGDVEKVVFEILEIAEDEARARSVDDVRREMAASIACRAAIKINMPLDDKKMMWLLEALASTAYPMSCPHGRPIALRYATREILRGFHRI
ncbi:MAG: DNA mismatch repair endonuclease MutL [Bryobacteraceae bacterium]